MATNIEKLLSDFVAEAIKQLPPPEREFIWLEVDEPLPKDIKKNQVFISFSNKPESQLRSY